MQYIPQRLSFHWNTIQRTVLPTYTEFWNSFTVKYFTNILLFQHMIFSDKLTTSNNKFTLELILSKKCLNPEQKQNNINISSPRNFYIFRSVFHLTWRVSFRCIPLVNFLIVSISSVPELALLTTGLKSALKYKSFRRLPHWDLAGIFFFFLSCNGKHCCIQELFATSIIYFLHVFTCIYVLNPSSHNLNF